MAVILPNLNRFLKCFEFIGRFQAKFAVKSLLKIPTHLAYVATPCETLISEKKRLTIDYKVV